MPISSTHLQYHQAPNANSQYQPAASQHLFSQCLTVTQFKHGRLPELKPPRILWLLLPPDFTSLYLGLAGLLDHLPWSASSLPVSRCSQDTWTLKMSLQKLFKSTLKINSHGTNTLSSFPERGFIYILFLIRLSIADAHQNATLADLVLALKFPNSSMSFLRHSYRLITGQSTSALPSHPDPLSSMYTSRTAL